jgi:hypothetical protein
MTPRIQPARSPAEIAMVEFMPEKRSLSGEMTHLH